MTSRRKQKNVKAQMKIGISLLLAMISTGIFSYFLKLELLAYIIFTTVLIVLLVSLILALFPKKRSVEYRKLNVFQRTLVNSSYVVEVFGYLSSILPG